MALRYWAMSVGVLFTGSSSHLYAHSIQQRVGTYEGSDGRDRQRLGLDLGLDFVHQGGSITNSTCSLSMTRDFYQNTRAASDDSKNERQMYDGGQRVNDAVSATVSQTLNRITELRLLGAAARDDVVSARTAGAGFSQWLIHETLQASFDVSRTFVEKPPQEILDVDAEVVTLPPNVDSTGVNFALKHLTTPSTIVQLSYTQVLATDRPPTHSIGAGVRQFVRPADGALHVNVARMLNRGPIGTDTRKGQVSAWQGEAAWLQNMWRGALARIGYRAYVEDETTRATESEKVYGSDTVSLNVAQELPKGSLSGQGQPLMISAGASRYLNNDQLSASTYEMGLLARF